MALGSKKDLKQRILVIIIGVLILLLVIFIIVEISLRVYFITKYPLYPRYLTAIPGVPYLESHINLSSINNDNKSPRIVFIGDYITSHKGSPERKSFPDLLAQRFNGSYQVVNTGTTFFSIEQEQSLIDHMVTHYDIDIFVVTYIINDIDQYNYLNGMRPLIIRQDIMKFKVLSPEIIIHIINRHKTKYREKYLYSDKPKIIEQYHRRYNQTNNQKKLDLFLDYLHTLESKNKTKIVFAVVPIFYDFTNSKHQIIANFVYADCLNHQLNCIDILEAYGNHSAEQVKENDGDIWHPNSIGINIIAYQIEKGILSIQDS